MAAIPMDLAYSLGLPVPARTRSKGPHRGENPSVPRFLAALDRDPALCVYGAAHTEAALRLGAVDYIICAAGDDAWTGLAAEFCTRVVQIPSSADPAGFLAGYGVGGELRYPI
jgi:hypothetical protein